MSGELSGVADIITGAAIARAVEPGAGEEHGGAGRSCLNCGTTLIGSHCHACGQNGHVHRTLHAFGHDFMHSVLHLDGKIWRTLPMLFWKPGDLTRRYVHGERAKFVSPLALFLFTVFLTFAVFSYMVPQDVEVNTVAGKSNSIDGNWTFTDLEFPGSAELNKAAKKAAANPQLLLYKIQSNTYKFSWALIPISIPFVWLLFFWRRRFKMFDHAVFVTYSITFMMLLGVICAFFINIPALEPVGGILLAFYPPIHMYRHIHHAYETSRFGAFWRMIMLSLFAMTALTLFASLIIALGVTG